MGLFYLSLRWFMRLALKIYFKDITIEGSENVPRDRPFIITPNHQNAFLDALLIGAFSPVPLYFLARSDIFVWWSRPLLRAMKMLPIYRIRDGYSKLAENSGVFKSCQKLFINGKSILIFAEGNHGPDYYLRPLTKGAARLALQSQEKINQSLYVVPVGLNYFQHQQPRSKVIIAFGSPISVYDYIDDYQRDQAKGLISMRDAIASGMKRTLIIPEETNNYESLKKSIFNRNNEQAGFSELRSMSTVSTHQDYNPGKHLLAKVFNPLPFLVVWKVLSDIEDIVFHSSLKFGIGLILFPVWWLLSFIITLYLFGIISASIIVASMIATLIFSYYGRNRLF